MSDGKNMMSLLRYFDAMARALATRCVLLVSKTCSSPSNSPGKDWVRAWWFRSTSASVIICTRFDCELL
jgi:hypothetical protein